MVRPNYNRCMTPPADQMAPGTGSGLPVTNWVHARLYRGHSGRWCNPAAGCKRFRIAHHRIRTLAPAARLPPGNSPGRRRGRAPVAGVLRRTIAVLRPPARHAGHRIPTAGLAGTGGDPFRGDAELQPDPDRHWRAPGAARGWRRQQGEPDPDPGAPPTGER